MAYNSAKSAPAYLLFDALDVTVSQTGAGATRYQRHENKCKISVSGDTEKAELTAHADGTLRLVRTVPAEALQDWTVVKPDGHVIAATKPYDPAADRPVGPFARRSLDDPGQTASDLRLRARQAFAAVSQMLARSQPCQPTHNRL